MMRHGYAEAVSRNGDDYFRVLTREGADLATRAARGLKSIVPNLDAIYTSPLRRARETGVIMGAPFGIGLDAVKAAIFLAETEPDLYFKAMWQLQGDTVLFVGHLPAVHDFVFRALRQQGQRLTFSPTSVAILSFHDAVAPQQAVLESFYTGEELAMLAENGEA
ncbi:MAG: histidine phosphatase family protein [Candidatus Marinimicrobia bacterium]|nr:histidine phosphatase family protein [Candidatus Neomarinimicrobiota bacterium]